MPLLILYFSSIIFLRTTSRDILLKVSSFLSSFKKWYSFDLITFLGFFNLLISGSIMAELILKSGVIIAWLSVLKTSIRGSPVTKTSELLWVGNLRAVILVIIWLLSSRVRLNKGRLFILRTVVIGLVIITFS